MTTKHSGWASWQAFRRDQKEVVLPAGRVNHLSVRIRYIDLGLAHHGTVLLLHGIPTWGFLYHAVIPKLVNAGYRVIAPDFLGHGWSDRRDRFDRSFQDQARMIIALSTILELNKVNIIGHDTGGAVALILAIEYRHLINRMVITNSVCFDRFDDDMLDLGHPLRWKPRPISDLIEMLDETLEEGLTDKKRLTKMFRDGIISPWESEEGKLSLIRNASALNANQTMALVDRHKEITAPTILLWGMDDPWQKSEDGKRLSHDIPGAIFKGIQHASHWVQQDAPDEFSNIVLEFFV
jgi:pimeloyl-ACP methyl ester carboxylesterase